MATSFSESSDKRTDKKLTKIVPSLALFAKDQILNHPDLSHLRISPGLQAYFIGLFGGASKKLGFVPYYTNGGQYDIRHNLTNIAVKDRMYYNNNKAISGTTNIVIKSTYVPSKSEVSFEDFLELWDKEKDGEINDEDLSNALQKACKDYSSVATGISIETAGRRYTAPFMSGVIFLGETPEFENITQFYDTQDKESI